MSRSFLPNQRHPKGTLIFNSIRNSSVSFASDTERVKLIGLELALGVKLQSVTFVCLRSNYVSFNLTTNCFTKIFIKYIYIFIIPTPRGD